MIFCSFSSYVHLFFNVVVQVVVGIPLEMVHGSFRIFIVYMAGVLAGEEVGEPVFLVGWGRAKHSTPSHFNNITEIDQRDRAGVI